MSTSVDGRKWFTICCRGQARRGKGFVPFNGMGLAANNPNFFSLKSDTICSLTRPRFALGKTFGLQRVKEARTCRQSRDR